MFSTSVQQLVTRKPTPRGLIQAYKRQGKAKLNKNYEDGEQTELEEVIEKLEQTITETLPSENTNTSEQPTCHTAGVIHDKAAIHNVPSSP